MDYFILTETSLFRLIRGEKKISPDAAYQDFARQVIELCKQPDDGYKAVALTCAEMELQFVSGVTKDIDLCAKKALAFVQKMLKLITDNKQICFCTEERKMPSVFQWTGKKADFVELIYGLQTMGVVNDGKTNVRDLLNAFNSVFGNVIPFEQCYATYEAIKRRKLTAKAAFIESMLNGLHNRMREDDRKEQARR